MKKNSKIDVIRNKLKSKEIHIIPYAHPDYAWTHYRQWHIERYILIINEVLDIMQEDPDFTWMTDSYNHIIEPFIKYCPDRVEEIRQRVIEGRIEITNGIIALVRSTQVGDETFIRNIVLGKRCFEGLFPALDVVVYNNVDVSVGHSQLPQLLKLGGYKYFWFWRPQGALDSKGIPRQFVWKGLDGTPVICSRGFYGGLCGIDYLNNIFKNEWEVIVQKFFNKELKSIVDHSNTDELWVTHGMDDSRPLRDYTDKPSRIQEFLKEWNKKEKCRISFSTAEKYFDNISKYELQVVSGVLDACDVGYNTPSKGEKGLWRMRKELDKLLVKAETLWSLASLSGEIYPEGKLNEIWMMLLGVSGHAQEAVMDNDFEELYSIALAAKHHAEELIRGAKKALAVKTAGTGHKQCVVLNTLNWECEEIIPIHIAQPMGGKDFQLTDANGDDVEYQICEIYKGDVPYDEAKFDEIDILAKVKLPGLGYNSISIVEKKQDATGESFGLQLEDIDFKIQGAGFQIVDTGEIKVKFREGMIESILDKKGGCVYRQKGCTSPLNNIKYTKVNHHAKNAWLFFSHYQAIDSFIPCNWRWEEYGPLRWKYVVKGNIGVNKAKQEIILYKGRKHIDFNLDIECIETSTGFFSTSFPIEKVSKMNADIPFGIEERDIVNEPYGKLSDNIIDNIERFWEGIFYANSWVDYNYGGYGNALVSENCGHYFLFDQDKETISIVLTKVVDYTACEDWMKHSHPWVDCKGNHNFKYSLYLHELNEDSCHVVKLAKEKVTKPEVEMKIVYGGKEILPSIQTMLEVQGDSVVISSFYKEGNRYLLRLYEAKGRESGLKIKLFREVGTVTAVDFLGNPIHRNFISHDKRIIETVLKPWEIINISFTCLKDKYEADEK